MYCTAYCETERGHILINFEATATATESLLDVARIIVGARFPGAVVTCCSGWTTPAERMDAIRTGVLLELPKIIGRG